MSKLKYIFKPKLNITAYELAKIMEALQISIDDSVFNNFDEDTKQHFDIFKQL